MNINDMELLLQRKNDNGNNLKQSTNNTNVYITSQNRYKSTKNASLQDFIDMVGMIVSKSMKKNNVIFQPDEGARPKIDPNQNLESPVIFYEVIERVPKNELKPRAREEIIEQHDDKDNVRQGRIWGQKFSCLVQFNFLACDYNTVNTVMYDFEDVIFNYTYYFKKNGVAEILFKKHFTDKNLDFFRQNLSVRSLQYYIEIEKLTTMFATDIEKITIA